MVGPRLHALRRAGIGCCCLEKGGRGCSFMTAFRKEDRDRQRAADPSGSFFKMAELSVRRCRVEPHRVHHALGGPTPAPASLTDIVQYNRLLKYRKQA